MSDLKTMAESPTNSSDEFYPVLQSIHVEKSIDEYAEKLTAEILQVDLFKSDFKPSNDLLVKTLNENLERSVSQTSIKLDEIVPPFGSGVMLRGHRSSASTPRNSSGFTKWLTLSEQQIRNSEISINSLENDLGLLPLDVSMEELCRKTMRSRTASMTSISSKINFDLITEKNSAEKMDMDEIPLKKEEGSTTAELQGADVGDLTSEILQGQLQSQSMVETEPRKPSNLPESSSNGILKTNVENSDDKNSFELNHICNEQSELENNITERTDTQDLSNSVKDDKIIFTNLKSEPKNDENSASFIDKESKVIINKEENVATINQDASNNDKFEDSDSRTNELANVKCESNEYNNKSEKIGIAEQNDVVENSFATNLGFDETILETEDVLVSTESAQRDAGIIHLHTNEKSTESLKLHPTNEVSSFSIELNESEKKVSNKNELRDMLNSSSLVNLNAEGVENNQTDTEIVPIHSNEKSSEQFESDCPSITFDNDDEKVSSKNELGDMLSSCVRDLNENSLSNEVNIIESPSFIAESDAKDKFLEPDLINEETFDSRVNVPNEHLYVVSDSKDNLESLTDNNLASDLNENVNDLEKSLTFKTIQETNQIVDSNEKEKFEAMKMRIQELREKEVNLKSQLKIANSKLEEESKRRKTIEEEYQEKIAGLDTEIVTLQECVEVSESHAEDIQSQLIKERARTDLIRSEMRQQEIFWKEQLEKERNSIQNVSDGIEQSQMDFVNQRETFQKTCRSLKAAIDEKTSQLIKCEETNSKLRDDILDLVSNFGNERNEIEKRLEKHRTESHELKEKVKVKNLRIKALEAENDETRKRLDSKEKEIKRLKKSILKLMDDLDEFRQIDERCFTIAKILDHIDNID